jgi:hypothetical protein
MNAIRVRVYRRDNAYWLMPEDRRYSGAALDRETLAPIQLRVTHLDENLARLNAMPVSADESRATLERVNARYGTNFVESD